MKQLFSYYNDGDGRIYEGEDFVTRKLEAHDAQRMRELTEQVDRWGNDSTADMEAPLTPLNYALIACGVFIIGIMIYLSSAFGSLDSGFEKSPLLVALLGILCVVAVVITVIDKKKRSASDNKRDTNDNSDELFRITDELDKLTLSALDTLGIASDEEGFDVITVPSDTDITALDEVDTVYMTFFIENERLILSDYISRYEFQVSDFKKVEHMQTALLLTNPIKPVLTNLRREYGVKKIQDKYRIPSYDLFTVTAAHGDYTLALPCYDGKRLAELLGLDY